MKSFTLALLVLALSAIAMSQEVDKKAIMKTCRTENKATDQEFEDLRSNKVPHEKASPAVRCTMKCVMEKLGVMDPASGEFLPDKMKAMNKDKAPTIEAIDKCKGQKGANACETAFMVTGCLIMNKVDLAYLM